MKDKSVLPATLNDGIVFIGQRDRDQLVVQARSNMIGRARICTHTSDKSPVQEMVIAFTRETYVHPHRHIEKSESFHVIEGELAVVFFDDSGRETSRIELGSYGSDRPFFFRAEGQKWHTVLIHSDIALVHETTVGPYEKDVRLLAPWAPEMNDHKAIHQFLKDLRSA